MKYRSINTPAILGGNPVRTKPFRRWPVFDEREKSALMEVLESGTWGGYSPKVREFEEAFADFHQVKYAVSASNGTVTLEAALLAAGVGPGDEVIVPPITFVATAAAVLRVGATPVFADIDHSYHLDPVRVEEAVSDRTRAIIPVHFAGCPADMDALGTLARKSGLLIIEDAAHAHGASWNHGPAGSLGDIASFSFQQSKNLTAGEGGILIGNNYQLIETACSIFNQGRVAGGGWFQHDRLGTNQRLTAWQAAVLLSQLERLPDQLSRRAENARYLNEQLKQFDFIEPLVPDHRVTRHSYHLYMIRLRRDRLAGISRDLFIDALTAEGIPGAGGYPYPLYRNKLFQQYRHRRGECPESERMCQDSFWVSHDILLAGQADLADFVGALGKIAESVEAIAALSPTIH
jgi:dTDP-4-amino-4,6-dideoxygalactose transaminase